jgi:hypothetical protein
VRTPVWADNNVTANTRLDLSSLDPGSYLVGLRRGEFAGGGSTVTRGKSGHVMPCPYTRLALNIVGYFSTRIE